MYRFSLSALALLALFACKNKPEEEITATATCDSWRPTLFGHDDNADGTDESTETYTYDSAGLLVERSYDADADGTPDWVTTMTYDAKGQLLTQRSDGNGDGVADQVVTYTYDGDGQLVREEDDQDGDGQVDWISSYEFDSQGHMTAFRVDYNADGSDDQVTTYGYDEAGNRISVVHDWDGNGIPDDCYTSEFDADGHELLIAGDYDCDLTIDSWQELEWTGDVVVHEVHRQGADFRLSYEMIATVDEQGLLATVAQDYGGNGIFDYRATVDTHGNPVESWYDEDDDGTDDVHSLFEHAYDDGDRRIRTDYDVDADGTFDMWETIAYDAQGNWTEYAWDAGDGEQREHMEYECAD